MKRKPFLLSLAVCLAALTSAAAQETAEIKIVAGLLSYDTKEITVKAGQKVKLTLVNPKEADVNGTKVPNALPHNLIVIAKGSLGKMTGIVNDPANLSDPNWMKNPIPKDDIILHHTKLLFPGSEETIEFTAPSEAGDYPYVCSFPGHIAVMNGVMKVEK